MRLLIGVIGDFDPAFPPHPATTAALERAAASLSVAIEVRWLATPELRDVAPEALPPGRRAADLLAAGRTMSVRFVPGSRVGEIYGTPEVTEYYYCNFGLNPDYQDELDAAGLRVAGSDQDSEARIVELPDHPLYVATLFVPQLNSRPGRAHPLPVALLEAASDRARRSKTHA